MDDRALGNENLTEMLCNLPKRLQSRSPSAGATRPACLASVALLTQSSYSVHFPFIIIRTNRGCVLSAAEWKRQIKRCR